MKKIINFARSFSIDAGHRRQVGWRRPLDRLERSKMLEQRPLAGRPNPRNFAQARFTDVAPPATAVRADRKAMRLVTQPFDEIENRVARFEHERLAAGNKKSLTTCIAIRPFGNGGKWHVDNSKRFEHSLGSAEL